MFDYHLHTKFSMDSHADIIDICKTATDKGIKYIAITDHIDIDHDKTTGKVTKWDIENIRGKDGYIDTIENARKKYPELNIAIGVEVGYTKQSIDYIHNRVKDIDPDFIIGSVHTVNGVSAYISEYFIGKTKKQAFNEYLENVLESVAPLSAFAHVIGHIGFVSKAYGIPYDDVCLQYDEHKKQINRILKAIIKHNMGIEINTSGLRGRAKNCMPDFDIVKRYKELGGEILTIGSDAHTPEHVGYGIELALDMAKSAGFEYVTVYEDKKPIFIKI